MTDETNSNSWLSWFGGIVYKRGGGLVALETCRIEPFSTIVTLGILAFKPQGTRLSITPFNVYIQTPGIQQILERTLSDQSRDNLCVLLSPITRALEMYPIRSSPECKRIYDLAEAGLKTLKQTYANKKHSNASVTIDHFIERISGKIEIKEFKEENVKKRVWTGAHITIVSSLFAELLQQKDNEFAKINYIQSIQSIIAARTSEYQASLE
jgi:hypothetical protein